MQQNNEVTLWKRAWRRSNGDVHSTRPYFSKEELLKAESEDSCAHGNEWCGEPFSFVADDIALRDISKSEQ